MRVHIAVSIGLVALGGACGFEPQVSVNPAGDAGWDRHPELDVQVTEDADAGPVCGNGVAEPGEECDGSDLRDKSCADLGLGSGTLGCAADCHFDTSGCSTQPVCGNGVAEPGEDCDGSDLRGRSCTDLGLGSGRLRCNSDCRFDTSQCATCGDGHLDSGEECDDGNMADGDGCNAACQVEDYFACEGEPSRCTCRVMVHATLSQGTVDGKTWSTAYTDVRSGLEKAASLLASLSVPRCQVWVAQGTYQVADAGGNGLILFDKVDLFGGFCETEETLADRDLDAGCDTTLSGDDGNGGSVPHVLTASGTGDATMDGVTVTQGGGGQQGGGLLVGSGFLVVLRNTVFQDNSAEKGGCIFVDGAKLHMADSLVENCTADPGPGGGLAAVGGSEVLVLGSRFAGNAVVDSDMSDGGGIYLEAGHGVLRATVLENNTSRWGAGLEVALGATLSATEITISDNTAGRWAGGLGVWKAEAVLWDCIVQDNHGGDYSGGIGVDSRDGVRAVLVLRRCRVLGNRVDTWAGGLGAWSEDGGTAVEVWVRDSLFVDNEVGTEWGGGALAAGTDGAATVVHIWSCTFHGNKADWGSARLGGIRLSGEGCHGDIWNTIYWGNDGRDLGLRNSASAALHASNVDWVSGTPNPNENLDQDPRFEDPGSGNFELRDDSPCLDMGVDAHLSDLDLQGRTRRVDLQNVGHDGQDFVDMGALERPPSPP